MMNKNSNFNQETHDSQDPVAAKSSNFSEKKRSIPVDDVVDNQNWILTPLAQSEIYDENEANLRERDGITEAILWVWLHALARSWPLVGLILLGRSDLISGKAIELRLPLMQLPRSSFIGVMRDNFF